MSPPSAVILSAYSRISARLVGRLVGVEARLLEQVLVVEQRRDVRVQRDAIEALVERRDGHVAGARGLELGPGRDLVGHVDELAGVLELRGVDQVHAHQVRDVARRDALGDLAHHLRMRDVGQVDQLVRVGRVPVADELVDHALVAARALPHLHGRSSLVRAQSLAGSGRGHRRRGCALGRRCRGLGVAGADVAAVPGWTPRSIRRGPPLPSPRRTGDGHDGQDREDGHPAKVPHP